MKILLRAVALALAFTVCAMAGAQNYPDKTMRIIVPFPPGGGTDTFARILGAKLTEMWGQQIIVDNRGGAQGNIGTALGAKAPPDGYTLTLAYVGCLAVNPHMYTSPGFDTLRDFAAVSQGTEEAWVLVAHPSLPVKTAKQLVALAKREPGKLTFASSASGTQLVGELFKMTTGTKILHVPYKGGGPAAIALLSGNVDMMFANPASSVQQVHSGKLRALLVTGHKRLEALPKVPTAVEAGVPDLDVVGWYGIVVPTATPAGIIAKLNSSIVKALASKDVIERMEAAGQMPHSSTPEAFATLIRKDYERWGKVVKAVGAKVD